MLIPGMTSSPSAWRSVADMPGYRFHYVQVKGFAGTKPEANAQGDVSAPVAGEIARYIKATGLERPAFIGHSMGGTMALMIAALHPAAVSKVLVFYQLPFLSLVSGPPVPPPVTFPPPPPLLLPVFFLPTPP